MARNFSAVSLVPPASAPIVQAMNMFQAQLAQPMYSSYLIAWALYNGLGTKQSAGLVFDFSANVGGQARLDRIVSVSVDNSNSNVPVYVYFPDSGYTVCAQPGEKIIDNVITSGLVAQVFGIGFTGGVQPQTTVIFANRLLQNSMGGDAAFTTPQYLASVYSGNPVANQTPYRALALGDQIKSVSLNGNSNTFSFSGQAGVGCLIGGPSLSTTFQFPMTGSGQYIYITNIQLYLSAFIFSTLIKVAAGAPNYEPLVFHPTISLTSSDGSLNYSIPVVYATDPAWPTNNSEAHPTIRFSDTILDLSGVQLKLNASNIFTLQTDIPCSITGTAADINQAGYQWTFAGLSKLTASINYTMRDESTNPI